MTDQCAVLNWKESREHLALTQAQMARLLGVHRTVYSRWEAGERESPAIAETAIKLIIMLHDEAPALYLSFYKDRQHRANNHKR